MTTARWLRGALAAGIALLCAGPAAAAPASDLEAGSVLFYSLVATDPGNPGAQETRLTVTNLKDTAPGIAVRLFLVDGTTGAAASQTLCLGPARTTSLDLSTISGAFTGFAVAVAVDAATGCPVTHNHLAGQAHVRLADGFRGTLKAVAIENLGLLPACNIATGSVTLALDGVSYERVPRVVSLGNFPSPADGRTLLVVNRVGGNLQTGVADLPGLFGILFDDAENSAGFGLVPDTPQVRAVLSDDFPETAPPLSTLLGGSGFGFGFVGLTGPSGRTGHLKLWSVIDVGILGAALHLDSIAGLTRGNARSGDLGGTLEHGGAANLQALTLSAANSYTVTRTTPTCPP